LNNLFVYHLRFIIEVDQSIDDIYDSSPEKQKLTKSPYFTTNESDEEKKEDDVVLAVKKTNTKMILEDSDSDQDVGFGFSTFANKDEFEDTPVKSFIDQDDFMDEDEAEAVAAAIRASMKDKPTRLKKKKVKSSLEIIPPPKKKTKKESKVIYLDDLEEEEPEIANGEDDGEISVASNASDDEEQKTATQVLNEANALSAKIVKIVSQWCGEQEGLTSNGLILGEGALSFVGGREKNTTFTQADDNEWISKETMKKIMPTVELAEYQLLGVNWMALLNRLTFMKGKTRGKKEGTMNVNGILADEMGLGKVCNSLRSMSLEVSVKTHLFIFCPYVDCANNCISGVVELSELWSCRCEQCYLY